MPSHVIKFFCIGVFEANILFLCICVNYFNTKMSILDVWELKLE